MSDTPFLLKIGMEAGNIKDLRGTEIDGWGSPSSESAIQWKPIKTTKD